MNKIIYKNVFNYQTSLKNSGSYDQYNDFDDYIMAFEQKIIEILYDFTEKQNNNIFKDKNTLELMVNGIHLHIGYDDDIKCATLRPPGYLDALRKENSRLIISIFKELCEKTKVEISSADQCKLEDIIINEFKSWKL